MKRQSFFVITKKGKYSNDDELLWFNDLDKAMQVFKLLVDGVTIDVEVEDVTKIKKNKDDYAGSEYLHYIKAEGDYKIESRHEDIYTLEEIEKLKKEREEVNKQYE